MLEFEGKAKKLATTDNTNLNKNPVNICNIKIITKVSEISAIQRSTKIVVSNECKHLHNLPES